MFGGLTGPGIWFSQASAVGGDAPLGCPGEVLPQVEPVGNLDRARGASARTVGVGAGAVPADHLHTGMGRQPVSQQLGLAALQQFQGAPVSQSISSVS